MFQNDKVGHMTGEGGEKVEKVALVELGKNEYNTRYKHPDKYCPNRHKLDPILAILYIVYHYNHLNT